MQPLFFVQNNYVERLTVPVAQFARAHGVALEDRSSVVGFDPEHCGIDWSRFHPVLPYGSVQFIRATKRAPSLAPYLSYPEAQFDAARWQAALGEFLLNPAGQSLSVAEVHAAMAGNVWHVRPQTEDKAFTAQVFDAAQWARMCVDRALDPALRCWLSPAQTIAAEWRCWFVDGRLVEVSQYRAEGAMRVVRGAPEPVQAFAQAVADQWLPTACVVMDVAQTAAGLRVVEFNPIHCSGWYAADVPRVLHAWLADACRRAR